MKKTTLKIDGMSCNHCKMAVEEVLKDIKEIKSYTVNLETGEAEIIGEPDFDEVIEEINHVGYRAQLKK